MTVNIHVKNERVPRQRILERLELAQAQAWLERDAGAEQRIIQDQVLLESTPGNNYEEIFDDLARRSLGARRQADNLKRNYSIAGALVGAGTGILLPVANPVLKAAAYAVCAVGGTVLGYAVARSQIPEDNTWEERQDCLDTVCAALEPHPHEVGDLYADSQWLGRYFTESGAPAPQAGFVELYEGALLNRDRRTAELLQNAALAYKKAPELSRPPATSLVEIVQDEECVEVGDFMLDRFS